MDPNTSETISQLDRVEGMQVCADNSGSDSNVDTGYIKDGIASGTIKLCPWCGRLSELMSGCNFVTCVCGGAWCFACGEKKGPAPLCPYGHPTHNSH